MQPVHLFVHNRIKIFPSSRALRLLLVHTNQFLVRVYVAIGPDLIRNDAFIFVGHKKSWALLAGAPEPVCVATSILQWDRLMGEANG